MTEIFKHHEFDKDQTEASELIRDSAEDLEAAIALWCVPSREKSLAMTKLEECVMWANKSLAMNGAWDFEEEDSDEGEA